MQLSWELRTGRGRRTTSTEVHFGQLEVLECLWPRDTSEPEYTEVRATEHQCARQGLEVRLGVGLGLTFTSCVPSQILSFPSSLGSQASARPCAHLRHTQTLRRVPKVTPPSPDLGALGCFPWCVDPLPPAFPGVSPLPPSTRLPCAPTRAQPGALEYVCVILSLVAPLLAHHGNPLLASRAGSGEYWVAFIKPAWFSALGRVVRVSHPLLGPLPELFSLPPRRALCSVFAQRGPFPSCPHPPHSLR